MTPANRMTPCPDCDRRAREERQNRSLVRGFILVVLLLAIVIGLEIAL